MGLTRVNGQQGNTSLKVEPESPHRNRFTLSSAGPPLLCSLFTAKRNSGLVRLPAKHGQFSGQARGSAA